MTDIERIIEVLKDFCINDYKVCEEDEIRCFFKVNVFNCSITIKGDGSFVLFGKSDDTIIDDKNTENIDSFLKRLRNRIKFMQQYQDVFNQLKMAGETDDKEQIKQSCENYMEFLYKQFK